MLTEGSRRSFGKALNVIGPATANARLYASCCRCVCVSQALKELSCFVVVDGIAQKTRQKLLRNLRVRITRSYHAFISYHGDGGPYNRRIDTGA